MAMKEAENSATKDPGYDQVVKSTGLFGAVQAITLLAGIIRNKIIAVLLGPSGVGIISLYNTTLTLVSNTTNLGIASSSVRNIAQETHLTTSDTFFDKVKMVRSWSLITALGGALICLISCSWLSYWTFRSDDYTLSFSLLSLVVASTAITGGEMAILKGMRKLKTVAWLSIIGSIATLIISAPLYLWIGMEGIVPSLVGCSLAIMVITLYYSHRIIPYRIEWLNRQNYKSGISMIQLGLAMLLTSILGSVVEYVTRAYIAQTGSLDFVGLYNAGYVISETYTGLIFMAMATDFFPRISAAAHNTSLVNKMVNQQIEVGILLITPMLVGLLTFLPMIIPLLYSSGFLPISDMILWASFGIFVRTLSWPLTYLIISKGDALVYAIHESLSLLYYITAIIIGYRINELQGIGISLSIYSCVFLIQSILIVKLKYQFQFKRNIIGMLTVGTLFLLITHGYVLLFNHQTPLYWIIGIGWLLFSCLFYLKDLSAKTQIVSSIYKKIKNLFFHR